MEIDSDLNFKTIIPSEQDNIIIVDIEDEEINDKSNLKSSKVTMNVNLLKSIGTESSLTHKVEDLFNQI